MAIIDLTHRLDANTSIYPGDPPFSFSQCTTIEKEGYSVRNLALGTHTGTHVDAPAHFVKDGPTIDQIPLKQFSGKAVVVDVTGRQPRDRICWEDVQPQLSAHDLRNAVIRFHTGWPVHWSTAEYMHHPFLDGLVAEELLKAGVKRIGIDALSPDETEGTDESFSIHHTILGAGGLIVENLCALDQIPKGAMISFPALSLAGGDGSPVRAYAWTS
ncbi:putative cyclase [Cylindrobasidium torrendii FP15055 ss-10]|uniref:Putative cyclase n=1 Tax=Cylindrobasidium torrendii FP15055 ss-10 TaxID=1314674 RepID=A0A0D7BH99_9AGAR|nr:putative cyclase [Cylindrobasidium torrendii FP15055 ss-10]